MSADVEMVRSSFGGGWACPLTEEGTRTLHEFFGEEPIELRPLCDRIGYIVEPYQVSDLAEHLTDAGITVEIG